MDTTIQKLWENYFKITPTIKDVKSALNLNNYTSFCDHIAFRTIINDKSGITPNNLGNYGIEKMSIPFLEQGYTYKNRYFFKEKNLRALHLEKKNCPKIFISELLLNKCSSFLKSTLLNTFKYYNMNDSIHTSGRKWNVNFKTYETLKIESEYAAWLYIHGHRVNHFTINVNQLKNYSIENVCAQLKTFGIKLNTIGGTIKGSTKLGLKQASTLADEINVKFEDKKNTVKIPSCYVEFAERFIIENKTFNGFITKSANNIFESTNKVA
ncbi:hypothetical protein A9Q86_03485 [Flavobacteriales bacterium 33_180_T64]|nr:hypothetical protein A9Q86_03485 [Flavobacteriales bacterium 33_180_T64]